jgi:hypothetical protein
VVLLLTACPWDSTGPRHGADMLRQPGGEGQSALVGTAVAVPPSVKVVDDHGNGVGGIPVTWTIGSGGGTTSAPTTNTDENGIATAGTWTLGKTAGKNIMVASSPGIEQTVSFTATGMPGAAAAIVIETGDRQTTAAKTITPISPTVRVVDADDNPVSGVLVTFSVTAGGGTVVGSRPRTDFNGQAAVGSWTLGPAAGINTLTATAEGVPPRVFTATATPPATQLVITTQPADALTGEAMDTQPVVEVRDEFNDLVTDGTVSVTATIGSGTGTLSGIKSIFARNGIAKFTNLAVTGTDPVTLSFASTGLTAAVSATFTPSPTPPLNLTIVNVHLSQAIQNYSGSVPLVAGRAAVARVFVKANTIMNTATPTVRVRTFQNGVPFKEYVAGAQGASVPKVIDEQAFTASWNVPIPASEVVTGMSILADVDPDNAIAESSESDNAYPASGTPAALDVRQVPTMKVMFIPVTQPGVQAGNISEGNKFAALDFAMRVYPFDTADVQVHKTLTYDKVLSGTSYDDGWTGLLSQVAALQAAEGAPDRYYYGMAHPAYTSGGTGLGRIGQPAAIGMDFNGTVKPGTNYFSMTIAHEWGHNFGRQHVGCGNPSSPDPSYPYEPLSIGVLPGAETATFNGYDIEYNVFYKGSDYKEFMSYCQPLWTSDYTYNAVMTWRATHGVSASGANQDVLLIWGRIGPSGVVLEPAYEIQAPVQMPAEPGPYTVQGLDAGGRSLFSISFAGAETDHAPGERTFAFTIPMPASGARPAVLRVVRGASELARLSGSLAGATRSVVPATLTLTRVGGGQARLEWDAASYRGAMVRDAVTGQVLAFLRGGSGVVSVGSGDVDVVLSDGVSSVRRRVSVR